MNQVRMSATLPLALASTFLLVCGCGAAEDARRSANESSAVTTLHIITAAQDEFRAATEVDQDGDKKGEYGFLGELLGVAPLRGSQRLADPSYLALGSASQTVRGTGGKADTSSRSICQGTGGRY